MNDKSVTMKIRKLSDDKIKILIVEDVIITLQENGHDCRTYTLMLIEKIAERIVKDKRNNSGPDKSWRGKRIQDEIEEEHQREK